MTMMFRTLLLSSLLASVASSGENNIRKLQQGEDDDGGKLVYAYVCDDEDEELKKVRPLEGGESVRICIERGRKAAIDDMYIMKINTFEFYKQDGEGRDAIIQKVIDNGALTQNSLTRFNNCDRGQSLCSFTTNLKKQFFQFDGVVKGIGSIAMQNGYGGDVRHLRVGTTSHHGRQMQDFSGIEGVTVEFDVEDGEDKPLVQTARWNLRDHWNESSTGVQALYISGLVVAIILCFCFCAGLILWRQCCADVITRRFRGEDSDEEPEPIFVYTEDNPKGTTDEDVSETHSIDDELDISDSDSSSSSSEANDSYDLIAYDEEKNDPNKENDVTETGMVPYEEGREKKSSSRRSVGARSQKSMKSKSSKSTRSSRR